MLSFYRQQAFQPFVVRFTYAYQYASGERYFSFARIGYRLNPDCGVFIG